MKRLERNGKSKMAGYMTGWRKETILPQGRFERVTGESFQITELRTIRRN